MKKWLAHGDAFEHDPHLVLAGHRPGSKVVQDERVSGAQLSAQRVGQQVRDEPAHEPSLLFQKQLLELNQCLEFMLVEQHSADIHLPTVFILVSPDTCRAVVFQGEAKGVDLVMTAGAVLALAMGGQAFTDGELLELFLAGFRQGGDIGRRRLGWIIEDHRVDPGAPGNRLGARGGGGHRHDGGAGDDKIVGGLGDDTITAGAGDDYVMAQTGDDTITTGSGSDEVYGGLGDDTFTIDGTGSKVIDGGGGSGDSLVINYSGISGLSDFGISESGDYTVLTYSNDDTIQFKNVANLTVGSIAYTDTNSGSDGYVVTNGYVNTSEKTLYLHSGGNASLNSAHQFEQVFGTKTSTITADYTITGSSSADTLNLNVSDRTGDSTSESFTGGFIIDLKAGNDVINSAKLINDDSINLGAGDDSVSVMFGADAGGNQTIANADIALLDGGAGRDTISYGESSNYTGTITLTTSGATNFENIIGTSTTGTITGDANSNWLSTADTLNGAGGDDILIASGGASAWANISTSTITNYDPSGAFTSNVTTSDDTTLNGGAGNDILHGGSGEDTLDGGTGKDYMFGGAGIDTFVVRAGDGSTTLASADAIHDFKDGTDLISMDSLAFDDLTIANGSGSYSNTVLVSITSSGEYLAIINPVEGNISTSNITAVDFMSASTDAQTINGTTGNDILIGGSGVDNLVDVNVHFVSYHFEFIYQTYIHCTMNIFQNFCHFCNF